MVHGTDGSQHPSLGLCRDQRHHHLGRLRQALRPLVLGYSVDGLEAYFLIALWVCS